MKENENIEVKVANEEKVAMKDKIVGGIKKYGKKVAALAVIGLAAMIGYKIGTNRNNSTGSNWETIDVEYSDMEDTLDDDEQ